MTLVGLLIFLLVAGVIIWAASTYLPVPFSFIVIAVVIIILLVLLLNSVNAGGVRLR